jgi:hypothetical protein
MHVGEVQVNGDGTEALERLPHCVSLA